jgi:hypothetical protein
MGRDRRKRDALSVKPGLLHGRGNSPGWKPEKDAKRGGILLRWPPETPIRISRHTNLFLSAVPAARRTAADGIAR